MSEEQATEKESSESKRERAKRIMRNKILKDGFYGFLVENQRKLPQKEDKPPTIVVDAYPLKDPENKATLDYEFKNTIWVRLIGVEGYEPTGMDRDSDVRTLAALFPEFIDPITKEGDGNYFRGDKLVGNAAYTDAQTEQLLQAMDVAQDLWDEKLEVASEQFFWAKSTVGKDGNRNFLNPLTYKPAKISEPEAHEAKVAEEA